MVHFILGLAFALTIIGHKNKYVQFIGFVVLFGFASLRYMYGTDYFNYYMWYTYIRAGRKSPFDEVLYTLLNQYLPSFFILVAIEGAVLVFVTYWLIRKNIPTEYVWLSMFIFVFNPYLFLMNLSAMRQCFAMACFMIAAVCAYRKKFLWYCVLMAVGALFHKSSLLLLPAYFIINDRPVKARTCWIIFVGVVAMLVLGILQDVVIWVVGFFDDPNYKFMAEQDSHNSIRATLLTSLYFVYTLFNLPKLKGKALAFAKLYMFSPLLGVLAREVAMLTRVQMYFDIFSVIALPLIFLNVQSRGPVILNRRNALITFWDCLNKYALPAAIMIVYVLRYYSFSVNPAWVDFHKYYSLFYLL